MNKIKIGILLVMCVVLISCYTRSVLVSSDIKMKTKPTQSVEICGPSPDKLYILTDSALKGNDIHDIVHQDIYNKKIDFVKFGLNPVSTYDATIFLMAWLIVAPVYIISAPFAAISAYNSPYTQEKQINYDHISRCQNQFDPCKDSLLIHSSKFLYEVNVQDAINKDFGKIKRIQCLKSHSDTAVNSTKIN